MVVAIVVVIVVVIVVIGWLNFVRYRGCARCPGTCSRRQYAMKKYSSKTIHRRVIPRDRITKQRGNELSKAIIRG